MTRNVTQKRKKPNSHVSIKSSPPGLSMNLPNNDAPSKLSKPPSKPPSATSASSVARKQLELELKQAKIMLQNLEAKLAAQDERQEQDEIISNCNSEHLAILQEQSNVEEWLEHSRQNTSIPNNLTAPAPAPALQYSSIPPAGNQEAIINLALTLKDMMCQASSQREDRLLSRLATPRELPLFSGDCIEWLHFKSAYEESTKICKFSDSENLWRLHRALRGEAKEAVADLMIGNTPPETILEALQLRFGRSELIIFNLTNQLRKLPPLSTYYQNDIINFSMKVNNCVATIRALDQIDYIRSPELASSVISKLPSTLLSKWTDYAYPKLNDGSSKLELLASFLKREAEMLAAVGTGFPREHKRAITSAGTAETSCRRLNDKSVPRNVFVLTDQAQKCKFCKKQTHALTDCRIFKRALRKDRWNFVKTQRLCFCCLLRHDRAEQCTAPSCDVDNCGLAHHRLLHWNRPSLMPSPHSPQPPQAHHPALEPTGNTTDSENTTVAHVTMDNDTMTTSLRSSEVVLLKVISVVLHGPKGTIQTYALLDDAASVSIMDSKLAEKIGLKCYEQSDIKFVDAFGVEVYHSNAPMVHVQISSLQENNLCDIKCRVINNFKLPVQNLSVVKNLTCNHLINVKNHVCAERVVPRLLIGQDNYFVIAPLEVIRGGKNAPYATRCQLGWTIHGCCGYIHSHAHVSKNEVFHFTELNNLVKNSFELESLGISTVIRDNKAHSRAIQILDDTSRYTGKQWEVGLPFKNDTFTMPDSFNNALSRLQILLRNFNRDPAYANRYKMEIDKLFNLGYARELNNKEVQSVDRVWYLPHFGVQNPNKPGKLRLVYDAAAQVHGMSLNDFLLTGPDLYKSLLGILLKFREHEVAFIGDIRDMFLRVKIRTEDQHVLRFLWKEKADSPLKICAMTSLIFGATCSPFIAQYIKNKNALKFEDTYPEATDVIINSHYMDDCLYSTPTTDNAIKLIKEITEIHKKGGFEIRGWACNKKTVIDKLDNESLAPNAVQFKHGAANSSERTLGLMWHINDDTFGFKMSLERIPLDVLSGNLAPTKSQMLSIIMSVYDIHGFITPFTIKSKILFQDVHRSGVDWKCHINPNEFTIWVKWLEELKQIESLRIPRCYLNAGTWTRCYTDQGSTPVRDLINKENNIIDVQLHAFCDASIKAFAAAIYWRLTRTDGSVLVCLAASKSRVTPLRPVSIPRLELQGALIAARLATSLQNEHKDLKPTKRYFWTDSSTVLQWIRSDPRTYKQYVAHRLGEIDEITSVTEWRYVPSKLNVADVVTKTDSPPLHYDDMWFQGPAYLRDPEDCWPRDLKNTKVINEDVKCELRSVNLTLAQSKEWPLPNEHNFSSWLLLVGATARILFFIRKCQRKEFQYDVYLLREAETLLFQKCQYDTFLEELYNLKQKQALSRNSKLLTLTPYLDKRGIICVGGRIDKAGTDLPSSRPIILDGRHKITRLLVEHYHRRALHGANELVVNELRQQYWVLRLRPTVRSVAASCLFCRYRRARPQPQRMADLPADRLQHHRRPFFATGLDYFGPMTVTVGRRHSKRYGLIFTCLTIRAIHIELTEDLTTDETIMALRRFIARRGTPYVLLSDNGTNLRGAQNELKRSLAELNLNRLQEDGAIRGIQWKFIPPGAPEMAGAWERMIRTVKAALKVCLKERAPHPQTLATFMTEVESLVNSRPITHVSNDPSYPEALTPNHFLIGTSSAGSVFGKFDQVDLSLRKQWRISQRLTDAFWSRWLKEYLPSLLPRQKWTAEERALRVGDYVLLVEPNLERGSWRHGVVSAVHPGDDGRVRVVDIKTRTGFLRRPVTRVALLAPTDDSAASAL